MANTLGERVWVEDAMDSGHWEYRTSSDRIRLEEQAKLRNMKIQNSMKTYHQKNKMRKEHDMGMLKQAFKNGMMTKEQAIQAQKDIENKYR